MGIEHNHGGNKNILFAFVLNAVFAVIELVGGYLTNSMAIMSDALHDFGDSLALLFSYFAEKASHKEADEKFTFGYKRFSILSALVNAIILIFGSLFVIYEAAQRLQSPEAVKAEGMVWLAILGILVNSISAYRLSKDSGINSRMVMLHLLEDLFGWVAVLIVSIILMFKPWYFLDSVLSILVSVIILKGVYKNLVKVIEIFLHKFPENLEIMKLKKEILKIDKVKGIHAIKAFSLDDTHFYLRLHVELPEETILRDMDKIKKEIKSILVEYNVETSSIEFESQCLEIKVDTEFNNTQIS